MENPGKAQEAVRQWNSNVTNVIKELVGLSADLVIEQGKILNLLVFHLDKLKDTLSPEEYESIISVVGATRQHEEKFKTLMEDANATVIVMNENAEDECVRIAKKHELYMKAKPLLTRFNNKEQE